MAIALSIFAVLFLVFAITEKEPGGFIIAIIFGILGFIVMFHSDSDSKPPTEYVREQTQLTSGTLELEKVVLDSSRGPIVYEKIAEKGKSDFSYVVYGTTTTLTPNEMNIQ